MKHPYQNEQRDQEIAAQLVDLVGRKLSPIASRYGYAETSLERMIKWKPMVLVLGNYSSGKSSLINELLGAPVQDTGQAPTDDAFTLITHHSNDSAFEEVEGSAVINDPELPFQHFAKHGNRFVAHLKMKKIDSPVLENIVLVDSPGMLDSVSEKDRGYSYQAVVSDFASLADLIVIMFDPHRPGTVRETHELLRKTLPAASYENRTVFVLNRLDECENLNDLLRIYGTLCWNLSQMTGRKDIPKIFLSYRDNLAQANPLLSMLPNQREAVKTLIRNAPQQRLEHLVSFAESHGRHLLFQLNVLENYGLKRRWAQTKGVLSSLAVGLGLAFFLGILWFFNLLPNLELETMSGIALLAALVGGGLWFVFVHRMVMTRFHESTSDRLQDLVSIDNQRDSDSWTSVQYLTKDFLSTKRGRYSLLAVQRDSKRVKRILKTLDANLRPLISNN